MCLLGTPDAGHVHEPLELDADEALPSAPESTDPPVLERSLGRRELLRGALAAGAGAALAAAVPGLAAAHPLGAGSHRHGARFRDLTHVFRAGFPVYGGPVPTRSTLVTIPTDGYYMQTWSFPEHAGTHVDAPGHFSAGKRLGPDIPPRDLVAPIVVIDISARAATNADAEVTVDDIRRFEHRHGRIPRRALVAMYSGWESRVGDSAAYRNADASGVLHFPGFGIEAAQWLLAHRDIVGIGVDTLSLDSGPSATFAVHIAVLGANRYGVENLRNLGTIPRRGAQAYVGLVPWEQGSGGPCRVIAHW